jgi:hypothetical protein
MLTPCPHHPTRKQHPWPPLWVRAQRHSSSTTSHMRSARSLRGACVLRAWATFAATMLATSARAHHLCALHMHVTGLHASCVPPNTSRRPAAPPTRCSACSSAAACWPPTISSAGDCSMSRRAGPIARRLWAPVIACVGGARYSARRPDSKAPVGSCDCVDGWCATQRASRPHLPPSGLVQAAGCSYADRRGPEHKPPEM